MTAIRENETSAKAAGKNVESFRMQGFVLGCVIMATRLGKVGETAAMRETSIVFGALIGMIFFREKLDPPRLALIGLIAAGAVLVELG